MNADELANWLDVFGGDVNREAAAMLRAQHAAIRTLREALKAMQSYAAAEKKGLLICDEALAATEAL